MALDLTPIRESRDFRLLSIGEICSGLGSQAALVAFPIQIFGLTHSPAWVGLTGAFELGPMIVVSLLGGAFADRHDRRLMMAVAQVGMALVCATLVVVSVAGSPPVLLILALAGLLAGCSALDSVCRGAMVPAILGPELMRQGIAFNYGAGQATAIIGPSLGGLLSGLAGVSWIYGIDGATSVVMLCFALAMSPQRPAGVAQEEHPPVATAIVEGLRFVGSTQAIAGAFLADMCAMTFAMPRALFVVLSTTVYHAGAGGTGALYSAISVGGTLAVLTSGWVTRARRLGRITLICVALWATAILGLGLVRSIVPAVALLAAAGWVDGISAVCRSTVTQTLTPDRLRGRMSAVYSLQVTSGPRFGDIQSGLVAGAIGALNAVVVGAGACLLGVFGTLVAFPALERYDAERAVAAIAAGAEGDAADTGSEPEVLRT